MNLIQDFNGSINYLLQDLIKKVIYYLGLFIGICHGAGIVREPSLDFASRACLTRGAIGTARRCGCW